MMTSAGNRKLIREWVDEINPQKILAPFGFDQRYFNKYQRHSDPENKVNSKTKIITRPDHEPTIGNRRTNSKLHAKAVIGQRMLLTGSCNFTNNSVEHEHEILHRIHDQKQRQRIEEFFDEIWEKSSEFNSINDTL